MPKGSWRERHVTLSEVKLHLVEAGEGPLVLLLHGFPDFWYGWRRQLDTLAGAGFRVVAPDMRGYNLSDKPLGLAGYRIDRLAADVAELIGALGESSAMVVGHDWGGVVAWYATLRYPQLVDKLAVLNAPPPPGFAARPFPLEQLLRSWYIYAFQLPGVPEAAIAAGNFALLRRILQAETTRPDAFTQEDLARYVEAFSQPGALSAALNYYRALPLYGPLAAMGLPEHVDTPVLVIWGEKDMALSSELAAVDPRRVPQARTERLAEAGHWVHLDQPARVNALLLDYLRA